MHDKIIYGVLFMLSVNLSYSLEDTKITTTDDQMIYNKLVDNITSEGAKASGLPKVSSICFQVVDATENMIGGLAGFEFYGSIIIDVLWVDSKYRNKGVGTALIRHVESLCREKKINFISVSTMEWWGATKFYEKNGFEIEFVRSGFENGYKQFHLIKKITT